MDQTPKSMLRKFADHLKTGAPLPAGTLRELLAALTDGGSDGQKGAFLGLLRAYDGDRLAGVPLVVEAARFLREHPAMAAVSAPAGAIDIVGTGGDGHNTYNISTAAAFVLAGGGVPVAKHGNRAVSSRSGASDVLAALGVGLDEPFDGIERAIREAGIGFLWAPRHHPAMKAWGPVRAELGFRTVFNLLGPLCNPARVGRQVIGVYERDWVVPVAEVMKALGSTRVWVVHGSDGLDELTTTGTTFVAALDGGRIKTFEVTPEQAGLPRAALADLAGGDAAHNAAALRAVLAGATGPYRDIVLLNAAAGFIVAGRAATLAEGATLAAAAIDSGAAARALSTLIAITAPRAP